MTSMRLRIDAGFAQGEERDEFEDDIRGGKSSNVSRVEGRGNLDEVEASEVDSGKAAQDSQGFTNGRAADFRCAGAGSEGRVKEVDVEGEVGAMVAEALANPTCSF